MVLEREQPHDPQVAGRIDANLRVHGGSKCGLQLNLLPDRTGQIPKADANRLKEFGDRLGRLFHQPPFPCCSQTRNHGKAPRRDVGTIRGFGEAVATVKYVVLQEDIRKGQRVEKFEVEAIDTFGRSRVLKATTIGWKRILKLEMPQVKMLKVTIRESRAEPWVTVAAY
jgi:alpha-L-fucosidase